jgi:hypothetical protein
MWEENAVSKTCFALVCLAALAGLLFARMSHPSIAGATTGSLAALWHFDESTGLSASDSSGNGNSGVLTGNTVPPAFAPGKFGNAINFNGVDNFVQVADNAGLEPSSQVTVEMWVNSSNPGTIAYLLSKGANNCISATYALYTDGGAAHDLFFYVLVGGGTVVRSPAAPRASVFDGNWHHVAGTYDGAAVHLFLDGVEQGTATPTSGALKYGLATTNDLFVATYNDGPGCFLPYHGAIDEARIWNRSLGANEILASAQSGLHGLWHFNQAAGSLTTADSSGYNNTGTLHNGATFASGVSGNFGKALTLDGVDDFVNVPNNSTLAPPNAITVEGWINPSAYKFYPAIVEKGNVGTCAESYDLFLDNSSGTVDFLVNTNGLCTGRGIISGGNAPLNAWTHVAGTYDGAMVKLYVGGTLVANVPHTGTIFATPGDVLIGKALRTGSGFSDSFFGGSIDELHVWARALSADEVKFLAGTDPSPACTVSPSSKCAGELVVPDEIDQELDGGSGGVVASQWEYAGPADPRHAVGLTFMVANDPAGTVTIRPASANFRTGSCATDKGSTPGSPTIGGLFGCEISSDGKSAFITGQQIPVQTGPKTVPSKTLHTFINLSDFSKVGTDFQWH